MHKKISVIIAVKPGRGYEEALSAIGEADYPKGLIEVIIVKGYQPSKQRNEAAKSAGGEIIYFLDNDSIVVESALTKIVNSCSDQEIAGPPARGLVAGVGGPSIAPSVNSFLQNLFGYVLTLRFGTLNLRPRYSQVGKIRDAKEDDLILCNLSFRKDIFLEEGGFDERLYPNEENELFHRLSAKGYKILYDPDLLVYRSQRRTVRSFISQIFIYGRGRMEQMFVRASVVSVFRLLPLAFVLYLILAPFIINIPYAEAPLISYAALAIFFSIVGVLRLRKIQALLILPVVYTAMHAAYGMGLLWGLARKILYIKKNIKDLEIKIEKIKTFSDEGIIDKSGVLR